ncbi:hypothetical protein AOLI_G00119960 [Acnodon oligacanthus]
MIRNIIIIQSLYWIQGIARADDVIQPKMIWAQMGQSATITCEHTKGTVYTQMYWFRQVQGESMKLIVFTASYTKKPEFGEVSFNMSKLLVRFILITFIHLFWIEGSAASNEVSQTPLDMFRKPGESAELHCLSDVTQSPSRLFAPQGSSAQLNCKHALGSHYYQMY